MSDEPTHINISFDPDSPTGVRARAIANALIAAYRGPVAAMHAPALETGVAATHGDPELLVHVLNVLAMSAAAYQLVAIDLIGSEDELDEAVRAAIRRMLSRDE